MTFTRCIWPVVFLGLGLCGDRLSVAATPTARGIFGKEHVLTELSDEATEAIVLVFLDPACPVVQQYVPRLCELYWQYNSVERDRAGRPIKENEHGQIVTYRYPGDRVCFLGVYSMPGMNLREMASHALDTKIPFRVLLDAKQKIKQAYDVTELAEVVVMDAGWNIVYQGTIDDQFYPGGTKPAASEHYLRDAIDAALAGKEVAVSKQPPQGCIISSVNTQPDLPDVTFYKDVLPILQNHCQQCHRPGGVGPMPLLSFRDTDTYADMIEEVVVDRRMPPWPGESPHELIGDWRLTQEQVDKIVAWVRGGRLRGNPEDAPPAKSWPVHTEWQIGEPDYVFVMPRPFSVPATGLVDYVYFPLEAGFPEDRYIAAVEVQPGSPQVVHHIQVHEYLGKIKQGQLNPLEQLMHYGPAVDGAKMLGSYTPGDNGNARFFGPESGLKLERGAHLLLELHYTPYGRAATDQSRIGMIFTDQPPKREIKTRQYVRKRGDFIIPANTQNHSLQKLYHFEKPVRILGVRPHMHSRGKSFRLELVESADVRLKDIHDFASHYKQRGETVLTVPIWDFNWQLTYEFKQPLVVPKGKALLGTGFWDNTKHNPRNPDWKVDVPWGQQTMHEMFNIMFIYEELE